MSPQEKAAKVNELRAQGLSLHKAARKVGTSPSTYYKYSKGKKPSRKKASKPQVVQEIDATSDKPIVAIIGTPEDVKSTLEVLF